TGPTGSTGPVGSGTIVLEVNLAANQTGATAAAWNTVKYDTIVTNTQTAYSTSTGLFTPKTAGIYLVNATLGAAWASGGAAGVAVIKNGAITTAESQLTRFTSGAVAVSTTLSCTAVIFCNGTTDTISAQAFLPTAVTTLLSSTNAGSAVNMVATL